MFESLPPETIALRTLLADLHDDLEGRVARLRLIMALEYDFGGGRGLILPGGTPAYAAYIETRQAFVVGNYVSVILVSQCLLENVLAAQINLDTVAKEVRGGTSLSYNDRPHFRETLIACKSSGLLSVDDERDLKKLANLRNSLAHFRSVADPSHIDRRSIQERRSAAVICEDDARFAMQIFIRILAKPAFRFAVDPAEDAPEE